MVSPGTRLAAMLALVACASPAHAGETLERMRARAALRCGVSEGIAGFSERDAAGRWTGIDADFCRAVSAAALGSPERVEFVPLYAAARFPALEGGSVDLLLRNTTWTLAREAGLGVRFTGVIYFDGQAVMVPAASGVTRIDELAGATFCVERGTRHAANLTARLRASGLAWQPLVLDSATQARDAFFAGRCRAYSSDASQLAAARMAAPGGAQAFAILPERISKEPLGPVVRGGDEEWFTLVRWVLFALIEAEELGITRAGAADPAVALPLVATPAVARGLGADPEWAVRAIRAVGNYGEIFERNLGAASPLRLERGWNGLWTQGGLHYSPPLEQREAPGR